MYTHNDKIKLIQQVKDLELIFGKPPILNIQLDSIDPNLLDVVGVGVVVRRKNGNFVLIRRRETPNEWAIPGGGVNPEENIIEGAKREVREEIGLEVEIDGLIRIGWEPNYSPVPFQAINKKRFGKKCIGLMLINFIGHELNGYLDCSKDISGNVLDAQEFSVLPFEKISLSYKILFVQQGIWQDRLENYPLLF